MFSIWKRKNMLSIFDKLTTSIRHYQNLFHASHVVNRCEQHSCKATLEPNNVLILKKQVSMFKIQGTIACRVMFSSFWFM